MSYNYRTFVCNQKGRTMTKKEIKTIELEWRDFYVCEAEGLDDYLGDMLYEWVWPLLEENLSLTYTSFTDALISECVDSSNNAWLTTYFANGLNLVEFNNKIYEISEAESETLLYYGEKARRYIRDNSIEERVKKTLCEHWKNHCEKINLEM